MSNLLQRGTFAISDLEPRKMLATELNSLDELKAAMAGSDGDYKLAAGTYTVTDEHWENFDQWPAWDFNVAFAMTGSNNTFDLSDAKIEVPVSTLRSSYSSGGNVSLLFWGDSNTIEGGELEYVYADTSWHDPENIDYVAYNQDDSNWQGRGGPSARVMGDNNSINDFTHTVRGSFPYGYGEIFGKGGSSTYGLYKRGGWLVTGDNTSFDGLDLEMQSFGHGIYMQGAQDTLINNSSVTGHMRKGSEMYEDGDDSLAGQVDYTVQEGAYAGEPIDPDKYYPLSEDGIRTYAQGGDRDNNTVPTGDVTITNTEVTNMRGAISLVSGPSHAELDNVTLRGNESGFGLPAQGGRVINSRADAAYGPAIKTFFSSSSGHYYDVEIMDAPDNSGSHDLIEVSGNDHYVRLWSDTDNPVNVRPMYVGRGFTEAYDWDSAEQAATDVRIQNFTPYELTLTEVSTGTTGQSEGNVVDNGTDNNVVQI